MDRPGAKGSEKRRVIGTRFDDVVRLIDDALSTSESTGEPPDDTEAAEGDETPVPPSRSRGTPPAR